jgi:WD40 repeat protein
MTTPHVRVLIATTEYPIDVESLLDWPEFKGGPPAPSAMYRWNTNDKLPIHQRYEEFVASGRGLIPQLFGRNGFRLDLSQSIDDGPSWQLGIFIAHVLHAAERLAHNGVAASTVVWATGEVRPLDLSVGGISYLGKKLDKSLKRLRVEAEAGHRIIAAWPKVNDADAEQYKEVLLQHGAVILQLESVYPLLEMLKLDLPAQAHAAGQEGPKFQPCEVIFQDVPQRDADFVFVDRAKELAEIRELFINERLAADNAHSPIPTKCVAIWGESGVGKTTFATEYAHRYKTFYSGVWYSSAEHLSPLFGSLVRLLDRFDSRLSKAPDKEEAAKSGIARFPSFNPPFLFIYDNVALTYNHDGNFAPSRLRDLIPTTGAHILLIAGFSINHGGSTGYFRGNWLAAHSPVSSTAHLELDRFSPDCATQFIQKRAERTDLCGAARLAEELAYMPGDLDQAARHCRQTGMLFDTYREKFRANRLKTLRTSAEDREGEPNRSVYIAKLIAEDEARTRARIGGSTKISGDKRKLELVRTLDAAVIADKFESPRRWRFTVNFSTGGTGIIACCRGEDFHCEHRAWDAQSGDFVADRRQMLARFERDLCSLSCDGKIAFSPDGNWHAMAVEDRIEIRRRSKLGSKIVRTISTPDQGWVRSIALSPDGRWLISNNHGSDTIRSWDFRKAIGSADELERAFFPAYREEGRKLGPRGVASRLGFSPDGKMVASSHQGYFTLWNFETARHEWVLKSSGVRLPQTATALRSFYFYFEALPEEVPFAFSPDGNWIVGGFEEKIKILDTSTGTTLREIRAHSGCVYSVAFSPDGAHVVSSGRDNVIKVWRL